VGQLRARALAEPPSHAPPGGRVSSAQSGELLPSTTLSWRGNPQSVAHGSESKWPRYLELRADSVEEWRPLRPAASGEQRDRDRLRMSSVTLAIRVRARARKDEFVAVRDGVLVVRVAAPPIDGRANEAVRQLLRTSLAAVHRTSPCFADTALATNSFESMVSTKRQSTQRSRVSDTSRRRQPQSSRRKRALGEMPARALGRRRSPDSAGGVC
jgi:hypothetical protein